MNEINESSTVHLRTGRTMPVMGLGTWKLTHNTTGIVMRALRLGYRMIDTSGDYGTQAGVGEGIRQSGLDRRDIYVVTKVEEDEDAYRATRQNLEELGLDYADLVLIHRPPIEGAGWGLWADLLRAKAEGLTKDIGVSNYPIDHIQALIDSSGEVPVVNQIEWSPFGHSREMLGYCQENHIIIQAYSPLTHGDKVGDDTIESIAAHYNQSPAQLLIRWNMQLGTVPLPKANHIEHLEENFDVFDFEISREDMQRLSSLNREYSALGSLPYVKH